MSAFSWIARHGVGSQGGAWDEANHKLACHPCGQWVTHYPAKAHEMGLIKWRRDYDPIT